MTDTPLTHALVADDEPHIGRIIKMKLEQGPFRVTLAYDGREAIETLEREPTIGLVLLDLMMPHLSGLDVLARMRADERWRNLPCIILTAAGQEQHLERIAHLFRKNDPDSNDDWATVLLRRFVTDFRLGLAPAEE